MTKGGSFSTFLVRPYARHQGIYICMRRNTQRQRLVPRVYALHITQHFCSHPEHSAPLLALPDNRTVAQNAPEIGAVLLTTPYSTVVFTVGRQPARSGVEGKATPSRRSCLAVEAAPRSKNQAKFSSGEIATKCEEGGYTCILRHERS